MDIKVQEVNGKLICQKYNHNEEIIMIAMEELLLIQERFLCVKCLQSNKNMFQILGIDQVKELIKEKSRQKEQQNTQQRQKELQIIKEFKQKMKNIQTQLLKDLEKVQRISQQWINEYDKKDDGTQLVNLIKGLQLLNNQYQKDNQQIVNINQSYFIKISQKLEKMIVNKDLQQSYDLLKQWQFKRNQIEQRQQFQQEVEHQIFVQVNEKQIIQNQQDNQQNISQIKLVNAIKQQEYCYAITFNNNGQIMVTGCEKDILVWKFEKGQMIKKKKLNGHRGDVYSLVFSKKINWFASGGYDNTIRCWKEQTNGDWISTQPGQQHKSYIYCLFLNSNEDELISCSGDNTIKAWKVNCESNQLDYIYTLDQKHTQIVYSISMNQQENYLVSCSGDKKIILWSKDNLNKWKYLNEIVNDDNGQRICFINNFQIMYQQSGNGINHFFEIKDQRLIRRPESNIQPNKESEFQGLFPTIFNNRKQIIVQKHNKYVYFLKKLENDKLTLISDPIVFITTGNWGSLTEDGEYLVIWNDGTKEFKVYQIYYK